MLTHLQKIAAIITFAALAVAGCSDISGIEDNKPGKAEIVIQTKTNNNVLTAAPGAAASGGAVEVEQVRMFVEEFELERESSDSLDFETENIVIDLPLDGSPLVLSEESVPAGLYDEFELDILPPAEDLAIDDELLIDGEHRFSLVVTGTYNGEPFVFTTKKHFELEMDFEPPIEVGNNDGFTIEITVDIDRWFIDPDTGEELDPTNGELADRINEAIEHSFDAFGKDHDGESDDDSDGDDDEGEREGEFEGTVTGVDLESRTFNIEGLSNIRLTENTDIEPDGDLFSLEEVAGALEHGYKVTAEGKAKKENETDRPTALSVKFEKENHDEANERHKFEGFVKQINLEAGTFSIGENDVIKLTEDTEINLEGLTSLDEIANALEDDMDIWSYGIVSYDEASDAYIALEVTFKRKEGNVQAHAFEGVVSDVNLSDSTIVLNENFILRITDDTDFGDDGLQTLEAVQEALVSGQKVIAWGVKTAVDEEDVYVALEIAFKITDETEKEDFEDYVTEVNLDQSTFTLENGTTILITGDTEISAKGDLMSLEEVGQAIQEGADVIGWGYYTTSHDSDFPSALKVTFVF